jgi:hypothetical protein
VPVSDVRQRLSGAAPRTLKRFVKRIDSRPRLSDARVTIQQEEHIVAALEKGITPDGEGYRGKTWNILGQIYFPKAVTDSTFAFETNGDPGQFVPVHVHPSQDEFILVQ